jgi:uncharacterized membrane protein (DUF485 family)
MRADEPRDPTPATGSETDVAPLGRATKPTHELTADEDGSPAPWDAIAASAGFKELLKAKARFIVPMTIFFVLYYFALPVLVGFFPELMKRKVLGEVNAAYLFAVSQFFVAWAIAFFYVRTAARWDKMAASILAKFRTGNAPR